MSEATCRSTLDWVFGMQEERDRLRAEREEMLSVLREVEWAGYKLGDPVCPVCQAEQAPWVPDPENPGRNHQVEGQHALDCRLSALLRSGPA